MGPGGPRFLGIFPASFGALTPPWPAPEERLGLKGGETPSQPLSPYHYPDLLSSLIVSGQDGPVEHPGWRDLL